MSIDPLGAGMPHSWLSSHLGLSMFQSTDDRSWSLGMSVRDVTSPNIERSGGAEFRLAPTLGFQGSYEKQRGTMRYGIHGVANFKAQAFQQLLSASIKHQDMSSTISSIRGGLAYRLRDAVIPYAEVGLGRTSIGFYYEFNVSGIQRAGFSKNAYELSLRKVFDRKRIGIFKRSETKRNNI